MESDESDEGSLVNLIKKTRHADSKSSDYSSSPTVSYKSLDDDSPDEDSLLVGHDNQSDHSDKDDDSFKSVDEESSDLERSFGDTEPEADVNLNRNSHGQHGSHDQVSHANIARGGKKGVAVTLLLAEMFQMISFYSTNTYTIGLCNTSRYDRDIVFLEGSSEWVDVVIKLFTVISLLLPLVGGALGDSVKSRAKVILMGSTVYAMGSGLLMVGDIVAMQSESKSSIAADVLLYISLVMIVIGTLFSRSNLPVLGALYWTHNDENRQCSISVFFHWYFWFTKLGQLIGCFPFQNYANVSSFIAFGSSVMSLICLVTLVCWHPVELTDSEDTPHERGRAIIAMLRRSFPCLGSIFCRPATFEGRQIQDNTYSMKGDEDYYSTSSLLIFCGPFFLFLAAFYQLGSAYDILGRGYEVKYSVIYIQGTSFTSIDALITVLLIPAFVLCGIPQPGSASFTPNGRVVIGSCIALLSALLGGFAALFRHSTRLFYLIPQFVILGISEIFFQVGALEFTYVTSSTRMKGVSMGLLMATYGLGDLLGLLFLLVFSNVKTEGYTWYPMSTDTDMGKNIQEGHDRLQYYIFVLSGLMCISIVIMTVIIRFFRSRES